MTEDKSSNDCDLCSLRICSTPADEHLDLCWYHCDYTYGSCVQVHICAFAYLHSVSCPASCSETSHALFRVRQRLLPVLVFDSVRKSRLPVVLFERVSPVPFRFRHLPLPLAVFESASLLVLFSKASHTQYSFRMRLQPVVVFESVSCSLSSSTFKLKQGSRISEDWLHRMVGMRNSSETRLAWAKA